MGKKTGYDTFGDQKPKELKIRLPMVADTSVETAVDIDTGLDAGDELGWTMVGMDWCFRLIATPFTILKPTVASADCGQLQLNRGEAPDTPVLYDPGNKDVIYDMGYRTDYLTSVGFSQDKDPWFRRRKPERTQMDALHLVFGTSSDDTSITTAYEIYAVLYYYLVTAPEKSGHEE